MKNDGDWYYRTSKVYWVDEGSPEYCSCVWANYDDSGYSGYPNCPNCFGYGIPPIPWSELNK